MGDHKDLKSLNEVYASINLNEFYDEDYCDYAIYRTLQRIPHIIDGFAQTQRKVMYTCIDKNIITQNKVADLASIVGLHTKYHHGNTSIETTITNMVPRYNNQIPLLQEDGTYGCRSEREASASRYISTRLYKYSKIIFNEIDNKQFTKSQSAEGKVIEPLFLIPVIPLLLINGQRQIGVGYSCNILPRDYKTIITIIKEVLTGKRSEIPKDIKPTMPLFKGDVYQEDDSTSWSFKGILTLDVKKREVVITEVPPKYNRESYLNYLTPLKEDYIKSINENINGDEFYLKIKLQTNEKVDKVLKNDALYSLLGLIEQVGENITVINTNDQIKRYDNIAEVLYEYIVYMIGIYKLRKQYILDKMQNDIIQNESLIKFIELVNSDQIILRNQKRDKVIEQIIFHKLSKVDDSYDYLLNSQIRSLTFEKIEELNQKNQNLHKEYNELVDTKPSMIWYQDIENFQTSFEKETKDKML